MLQFMNAPAGSDSSMKRINVMHYDIIKTGVEFKLPDSAKEEKHLTSTQVNSLLPHMERNETYVYWLQPKHGQIEQQEACICVNGQFYMLNGKLEKAIFRNVRLTRDFKNYEKMVDGTPKLVIPRRLMQEKLRTSNRVFISLCPLHVTKTKCGANRMRCIWQNFKLMRKIKQEQHEAADKTQATNAEDVHENNHS